MKILITGTSSGVGAGLARSLMTGHDIISLNRSILDLSLIDQVQQYDIPQIDMLINCAGVDIGGKIDFTNHQSTNVVEIMNTNLVSPMLLVQKALIKNNKCKIVNITSTNNKKYYANNLAYSLSKKALSLFGDMLRVDYPELNYLEVQLGLTKTNFNINRYNNGKCMDRYIDIYSNPHLTIEQASAHIVSILFDQTTFIEVSV